MHMIVVMYLHDLCATAVCGSFINAPRRECMGESSDPCSVLVTNLTVVRKSVRVSVVSSLLSALITNPEIWEKCSAQMLFACKSMGCYPCV
jgi:hypothetical protein